MSTLEFICPALTVDYHEPRGCSCRNNNKLQNISFLYDRYKIFIFLSGLSHRGFLLINE